MWSGSRTNHFVLGLKNVVAGWDHINNYRLNEEMKVWHNLTDFNLKVLVKWFYFSIFEILNSTNLTQYMVLHSPDIKNPLK